LANGKKVFA
jgi:hypothetical protein